MGRYHHDLPTLLICSCSPIWQRHRFKVSKSGSSNLLRSTIWVCGGIADTQVLETCAYKACRCNSCQTHLYNMRRYTTKDVGESVKLISYDWLGALPRRRTNFAIKSVMKRWFTSDILEKY